MRSSALLLLPFFFSISNPFPYPYQNHRLKGKFSILNYPYFEYPPPPTPPPLPPPAESAIACEEGLGGSGSFDTICELNSSVFLPGDIYIKGSGSFSILPNVILSCPIPGCSIVADLAREFLIGANSTVVTGSFQVAARNMSIADAGVVNTTGLGGDPPAQTSGAGSGTHGDGGGHGGRGASCYVMEGDTAEDSWGGDVYAWDTLTKPVSYGSKGGSTSLEKDYGGGGGGRIMLKVDDVLEVDGVISADGGDGGSLGGGGSGGSIRIITNKM